jgi:hypothetical protein
LDKIPIYPGEPENPSQAELIAKAHNFLKNNRRKEYKRLSVEEREEWAQEKAKAARSYAENLIACGESDVVAWNRAIRLSILESDTD